MFRGQTADPFPKQWGFSLGQTAGVPSDGPGNHYPAFAGPSLSTPPEGFAPDSTGGGQGHFPLTPPDASFIRSCAR